MFSSLKIRNFRIYWVGMFLSLCGTWIQSMAQSWLVYDLSQSSFLLGVVGFVTYIPMLLFSLFSGVVVDRVNRRYLLVCTQIVLMVLAFLLGAATQFNMITVQVVIIISLLNGIVLTFDAPARQTILFELVGRERILNAIALNSIAFHSARMIGPALAGMFIGILTIAGCFYLNAVSFLAFIVALLVIRPQAPVTSNNHNHFLIDLKSGLRFMKENPIYVTLVGVVGVATLFGFSYVMLLPVVAKTVLHLGVKGYGLLLSASGIGSIAGGLLLAGVKKQTDQLRMLVASLFLFSLSLMSFALTRTFFFAMGILIVAGFSSLSSLAIINSLIQTRVPNEFRGRVMSIYMLMFAGTIPFGSLLAGSLAHIVGVSLTLFIFGGVCFLIFVPLSHIILRNQAFVLQTGQV